MKIKNEIIMKHQGHWAHDLLVAFDADTEARKVVLAVEWVDSILLEWFVGIHLLSRLNNALKKASQPALKSLHGFEFELLVDGKVRFDLRLIERDFEPRQPTLMMSLKN